MNSESDNHNGNFWAGLLIGGLIGAGITYFLSSDDKEEARRVLKEKGKMLLDDIVDFGEGLYQKGEIAGERVQKTVTDKVRDISQEVGEVVEKVEERAKEKVQEIPEMAQEAIENVRDIAETAVVNIAKSAEEMERNHVVSRGMKNFFFKKGKRLGK